jgi:hypothetical protein
VIEKLDKIFILINRETLIANKIKSILLEHLQSHKRDGQMDIINRDFDDKSSKLNRIFFILNYLASHKKIMISYAYEYFNSLVKFYNLERTIFACDFDFCLNVEKKIQGYMISLNETLRASDCSSNLLIGELETMKSRYNGSSPSHCGSEKRSNKGSHYEGEPKLMKKTKLN